MKWNELSLKEKAELMKLYVSNGITNLDDIITHYNAYQEGGKITFEQWKQQMQQLYPDIEMDNNRAGYDYNAYFNNNYNAAIAQLTNLQHFPDAYKLPNHKTFSNESIYSRSPMMGGNWINDSTFYPSIINRQQYPDIYKEDRPYTEREIYGNEYQLGGILNKIRSYFAPTYGGSFNQAYATAVKNNDEYFKWNGNRYNTKDSGIKRKPSQTMPDYSQLPFKEAYKKASKELPVKGEFGWNGAVYSANNAMENTDLTKIPVYKLWETVTGQPWSKAKEWGFTDGLAKTNIGLRKALLQAAKQCRKIENATPVEILRVLKNGYISTDIDNGFNVPLNETPITIKDSKAGQNQGTVFFPTVLDSLAVHGFNTNTSPVITFGLPAQESAMSPLYGHQTTDAEDFNNFAVGQMFSAWNVKTTPLDDLWKYVSDAKNDSEANMTIKNGAPYSFKKYADYILPSNIIDWSYNKFKSGTYNTGDENHTRDVIKRGTDFLQANEVQNWFYNHWLPGQSNQQEWIDWWNNYQQGGSLGKVTPYGQWQYPHQVTTIPSNNITMKGVDYPVLGISDTGDTKYMLPNMDYLFDGNYVTEYPLHKFQRGGYITNGRTLADGRTVYPISDLPAEDTPTSLPAAKINLKPVTVTAKHPLWNLPDYQGKEDNPNINAHKDELYQNRRRREEAGKDYMKWAAPLAMSPLAFIAGPTVMKVMNNPLVDAAFTADAVRNLPTALGDIKDNFSEGKIGRGLLQTGETALDLWGAGKLGKIFNKAWQKAFNLNNNLGITNNIIPITRPISKNPILNYNPEILPSELEHPFFLSHTLTGKDLAKALKDGSPAPSIGIIRGNNGKPSFTYPIYANDGIYTFYFKPDYLNSKEYVATPFDMFSPTIDNAETYIGRELSPTEIVNAKRDMYNRWGTLNDLQNTVNFSSKLIENQKDFDRAVRKSQQFKSLQDVKNKMVLRPYEAYGEMMPLNLIDLEKAALVVGGGSKNPDIANFLTNMNFYELYKPHKIDNFYDIPGLAFQKGGYLYNYN